MGSSLVNQPFWGTPNLGNPQMKHSQISEIVGCQRSWICGSSLASSLAETQARWCHMGLSKKKNDPRSPVFTMIRLGCQCLQGFFNSCQKLQVQSVLPLGCSPPFSSSFRLILNPLRFSTYMH